jgi:hypothetical protein
MHDEDAEAKLGVGLPTVKLDKMTVGGTGQ